MLLLAMKGWLVIERRAAMPEGRRSGEVGAARCASENISETADAMERPVKVIENALKRLNGKFKRILADRLTPFVAAEAPRCPQVSPGQFPRSYRNHGSKECKPPRLREETRRANGSKVSMAKTPLTNEQRVNVARDVTLQAIGQIKFAGTMTIQQIGRATGEMFAECLKAIEKEYGHQ